MYGVGCVLSGKFAYAKSGTCWVCLICVDRGEEVAFYIGLETINLGERVQSYLKKLNLSCKTLDVSS